GIRDFHVTGVQTCALPICDVIVAVNGKPADAAGADPLRGPPGSEVTLTIAREGREDTFDVTVQRETIRVPSIRARMLEPGYGYEIGRASCRESRVISAGVV